MPSRFLYLVRHGEADDDGALTPAGEQQAKVTGQRLSGIRFSAIRHSPLQRAEQTAELIAGFLPGVPLGPSGLLGDYPPPATGAPEPDTHKSLLSEYSEDEQADGEELAAAAIARYAGFPAGLAGATRGARAGGAAGAGGAGDADSSELIVTHNFLIGWFVRHALDAPPWRWIGLNQCNAAITVILYRPGRPASLVSYNDVSHLPARLRWTGFPPGLIPPEPHLPADG